MERRAVVLVVLFSLLGGCEGEPAPKAATPRISRTETKPDAPAPLEPPAAPAPAPTVPPLPPAPEPPGEAPTPTRRLAGQPRALFKATASGCAHLAWLAHHEYPQRSSRPRGARRQLVIKLAALVLARASTAGEAMRVLPTFSAACGSCHTAIAHRDFNATEGPVDHGDATMALLQGLTGPADAVFARATAITPRIIGKTDPDALLALQKACASAAEAATWVERTRATEAIFSQCGSCHEKLR